MTDALLPAPASICSQDVDCKWVRRNIGGSVIRLDIARDTVSVDLNIKSARGHTSIHMTPWDSQSQYKRWSNTYKPRDRTAKQIDTFRAAERKARAILTSHRISLHRTAGRHRAWWGLPPQSSGFDEFTSDPCGKSPMEYSQPPQDQRRAEAQEDMGVAHGATSTWTSENPPSPAFPPPPSCEEEDLEELHMNKDQGPWSSDAPHNYEEEEETPQDDDYQPQGQLPYEDVSMDEDEDDSPEDLRKATALPKEAIGLKESPANYVPKSPKYVRDSEDEGAQDLDDDDIGTPYLAPQRNPEQGLATQDIQAVQALLLMKGDETGKPLVDYSSSDLVPELVDSDGEVCSGEAPPKMLEPVKVPLKKPIDSKTSPFTTTAAVVKISPPQFLNASPRKSPVMQYTSEAPLTTQEILEDEIIYIDDSEDPAPIKQLTHHADKILMLPPVDTTLVSRKTVPLPVNDQHNQRKRGLASRRKAKPLKLQVRQVARMRTGPVNHQCAQLMTQLTSAVVPLKKLQISETPQDTGVRILPTPQSEEFALEAPKMQ